jgi:hypothetical protein
MQLVWERGGIYAILAIKSEGNRPLGIPRVGGRITLKLMFVKKDGLIWTGFI